MLSIKRMMPLFNREMTQIEKYQEALQNGKQYEHVNNPTILRKPWQGGCTKLIVAKLFHESYWPTVRHRGAQKGSESRPSSSQDLRIRWDGP